MNSVFLLLMNDIDWLSMSFSLDREKLSVWASAGQGCRSYPFVVDHLKNSFTINHLTCPCSQSVFL
ncbi:hypothetical protein, partial [Thauera butanivorans]|uniref:hypothetical protein n=1 Tax=Thauera butanivorans TaxID=86174 RepID=UPI001C3F163B